MSVREIQKKPNFWEQIGCQSTSIYILGIEYKTSTDEELINNDVTSRIWFTYRAGFEPIFGNNRLTTDTGWGCMHRSGQMLLAEALVRMHLGRNWRWFPYAQDETYWRILKRFQDRMSAHYSIHNLCKYLRIFNYLSASNGIVENKNAGDWFGPNTISRVLKKLSILDKKSSPRVYVTNEYGIIIDEIKEYCSVKHSYDSIKENHLGLPLLKDEGDCIEILFPNSTQNINLKPQTDLIGSCGSDPEMLNISEEDREAFDRPWDAGTIDSESSNGSWHPLLLIIPLRLGLEKVNPIYYEAIKAVFRIPYTVGILGGRPNKAQWSFGVMSDYLISLDPHTTQPAAIFTTKVPKKSEDNTFHCNQPIYTQLNEIDPSLALGFFCGTEEEFEDLCNRLQSQILPKASTPNVLVEVHNTRPVSYPPDLSNEFSEPPEENDVISLTDDDEDAQELLETTGKDPFVELI